MSRSPRLPPAAVFPLKALGWSLGLFALLRSPWVEGTFVLPFTRWQQGAAEFYAGPPTAPISVTADCSGTDVLALCLAAILAWPASWRARLAGAAGGLALILTLNTARIGTLGRAAASPALFEALHLQIWPAILVLAAAGYAFWWMRATLRANEPARGPEGEAPLSSSFARRFVALTALCLVGFAFCGPWIARSESLLAAGAWIAGEAALILAATGLLAHAAGNVLTTSRGAFMVTPECLATALVPLYLAFVFAAPLTWPRRFLALALAPPFFALLAIARVLLLALPPFVASSPLFLVHGFHQMVLALMAVAFLAWRREPVGRRRWFGAALRAALAIAAAASFAIFAGGALTRVLLRLAGGLTPLAPHTLSDLTGPGDAQGALATLFAFQSSFLLAIGVSMVAGWPRLLRALGALFFTQLVFLVVLVEFADRAQVLPHALFLRGFAVGLPIAIALAMLRPRPRVETPLLRLIPDGPA
jgi:exosortase/archaeosortase family protein